MTSLDSPDFTLARLYAEGGFLTAHSPQARAWLEDRFPQAPADPVRVRMRYAEGERGVEFADPAEVRAYLAEAGFSMDYVDRVGDQ